ncbi:MAG: CmcI family methyltransferase [Hyphomicrobiaceae bacterium]
MATSLAHKLRDLRRRLRSIAPAALPHEQVGRYAGRGLDPSTECAKAATDLERLFWTHEGRLVHKWPHYLPIHQRYLEPFKQGFATANGNRRPVRLLEIGVSHGGSLELWRRFLGPQAIVFGIDIDPRCRALDQPDLPVRVGSQADAEFLSAVVREMGGVDVVIDDGSHIAQHQKASLDALFPLLSEGGLYIVEDTQTSYWRQWEGGFRRPGTFIELAKTLVDDMHAWYHAGRVDRPSAKTEVSAVSFHDGIVVIEKRQRAVPVHVMLGKPSH